MNRLDARIYLMGATTLGRLALRHLLVQEAGCQVVAVSGFEATGVWLALREKVHLVVVDCDVPDATLVDAVQMVPRLQPRARILVLTGSTDEGALLPWRGVTLDGIVSKNAGVDELRQAIDLLVGGKRHFADPVRKVLQRRSRHDRAPLSPRETELLPLLATGMKLQDAAGKMQISYKTADCYRTSLLRKLGLRDRVELARYAIRERIVNP